MSLLKLFCFYIDVNGSWNTFLRLLQTSKLILHRGQPSCSLSQSNVNDRSIHMASKGGCTNLRNKNSLFAAKYKILYLNHKSREAGKTFRE